MSQNFEYPNLLVPNTDMHSAFIKPVQYTYDNGWFDGTDVTGDGRAWDSYNTRNYESELESGTYELACEVSGADASLNEMVRVFSSDNTALLSLRLPTETGIVSGTFTLETADTIHVACKRRGAKIRCMLTGGDTPRAWAPAEGEAIAGGGISMSKNLWNPDNVRSGEAVTDGVYTVTEKHGVVTSLTSNPFSANQSVHVAFSIYSTSEIAVHPSITYSDSAGHLRGVYASDTTCAANTFTRVSKTLVVPSGMSLYSCYCGCISVPDGGYKLTGFTVSLGSDANVIALDSVTLVEVDDGTDGIAGKDGTGIASTAITYGISTSESVEPTTWTSDVPTLTKGSYLWTKTVWTYTDSTTETGYQKAYIPKDGNDGTDGVAGKDGTGIASTDITYAGSTSGTAAPTSGWTSDVPSVDPGSYLWTKTVWTYTDSTTETGYSVAKMGDTGPQGETGNGINTITEHYAVSTSNDTAPTSWTATVPELTATNKYLWNFETIAYTDGSSVDTSKRVIGVYGDKGATGATGPQGPQGPQGETGEAGADGQMLVATSSTAAGTKAKVATLKAGTLTLAAGVSVTVVFTYANTAASPTLNISGTGAKAIHTNGTAYAYWAAGMAVTFVYDGTYWQVCSVPVYGSTATIGNAASKNVYIDSDSVDIRSGTTTKASFAGDNISLGVGSDSALIDMVNGHFTFKYDTNSQYSGIKSSDQLLLITTMGKPVALTVADTNGVATDIGIGLTYESDGTYAARLDAAHAYIGERDLLGSVTLFSGDYDTTHSHDISFTNNATWTRWAIIFETDDGYYSSVIVDDPVGKTVMLTASTMGSGQRMILKSKEVAISKSGSTVTVATVQHSDGSYATGLWMSDGTHYNTDCIGIVEIVGWR